MFVPKCSYSVGTGYVARSVITSECLFLSVIIL